MFDFFFILCFFSWNFCYIFIILSRVFLVDFLFRCCHNHDITLFVLVLCSHHMCLDTRTATLMSSSTLNDFNFVCAQSLGCVFLSLKITLFPFMLLYSHFRFSSALQVNCSHRDVFSSIPSSNIWECANNSQLDI